MLNKEAFGKWGEKLATNYLRNKGFCFIEANYRNSFGKCLGEIDLIFEKDGYLIFVEVKTRKKNSFNYILPEENINRKKLYKLSRISQLYIKQKRLLNTPYRFDSVCITYDVIQKKALIRHLENIFI